MEISLWLFCIVTLYKGRVSRLSPAQVVWHTKEQEEAKGNGVGVFCNSSRVYDVTLVQRVAVHTKLYLFWWLSLQCDPPLLVLQGDVPWRSWPSFRFPCSACNCALGQTWTKWITAFVRRFESHISLWFFAFFHAYVSVFLLSWHASAALRFPIWGSVWTRFTGSVRHRWSQTSTEVRRERWRW